MFVKIYYQDFRLNAGVFNDDKLVLDETKSVLVASYNCFELKNKLESLGMTYTDMPDMNEICDMMFKAFNLYPVECCTEFNCFEKIGHTSMSIGDYAIIEKYGEEDVLICASSGWYGVGNLESFKHDRDKIIDRMMNLPVKLIRAMLPSVICEGVEDRDGSKSYEFNRILNQFLDKRCEDKCPVCHSEKIDWGEKDYCDSLIVQNGTCEVCGLHFTEEYRYACTSVDEEVEKGLEDAK